MKTTKNALMLVEFSCWEYLSEALYAVTDSVPFEDIKVTVTGTWLAAIGGDAIFAGSGINVFEVINQDGTSVFIAEVDEEMIGIIPDPEATSNRPMITFQVDVD